MDLSNYLDEEITVRLRNGDVLTSTVWNNDTIGTTRYNIYFYNDTYTDNGQSFAGTTSENDIVEVISSNSTSSNNMSTSNQTPQTVSDFIALLTAVKEQYGDIQVRYASSSYDAAFGDCRDEFEDILVSGGCKSLITDNNDASEEAVLVFVRG